MNMPKMKLNITRYCIYNTKIDTYSFVITIDVSL